MSAAAVTLAALALLAVGLTLTGCVTTVTMKNPATGQIFVCQRPTFGSVDAATSCAAALARDGWIELGRD